MCVVAFDWQPSGATPLRLISNRDEFFDRPTQPMQWWGHSRQRVLSGRDERAGGTWLAMSMNGRVALVTNFRRGLPEASKPRSRGELPLGWLTCTDPLAWARGVSADQYAPFNLIGLDLRHAFAVWMHHGSSTEPRFELLTAGLYGLSNGLLNEAWPKSETLRQALTKDLDLTIDTPPDVLVNDTVADQALLPRTGLDMARELALSPVFIRPRRGNTLAAAPAYGTRTSTTVEVARRSACKLAWNVTEWQHTVTAIGQTARRFRFTNPA
jgi:uncharacterized protein with NRDE domain